MGSLNKVMLIGNLGCDPELKKADSGTPVCHFRMATRNWRSANGNGTENTAEWHNIVAFGKLAELGSSRLHKGSRVYIEGRLRTRSYQPQQGDTRWFTEIIANDIQFMDAPAVSEETDTSAKVDEF
jgi:single-strand DNA-binding protein